MTRPVRGFCYVVTYDLRAVASFNYTPFFLELQQSIDWWHFLTNTWLLVRSEPLSQLQTRLTALISNQDSLLILSAEGPTGGYLPQQAWDWINSRLPVAERAAISQPFVPPSQPLR